MLKRVTNEVLGTVLLLAAVVGSGLMGERHWAATSPPNAVELSRRFCLISSL